MLATERRTVGIVAVVAMFRMFGLFALLPVLSIYAADLAGAGLRGRAVWPARASLAGECPPSVTVSDCT